MRFPRKRIRRPALQAGRRTDPRFTFDRSRYPGAYLALAHTEAQVQRDILRALRQAGVAAFTFDAGGKAMRLRAGAGGAAVGAAGLPDIVGWLPGGRALFIEVKRPECRERFTVDYNPSPGVWVGKVRYRILKPAGKVTDAQAAFLTRAIADGCAAGVAWSVGDALEIAGVGK